MDDLVEKTALPPLDGITDRNFLVAYYGHGDIYMASWRGSLDYDPTPNDGLTTAFNIHHGADLMILAGLVGYYKRLKKSDQVIADTFLQASRSVLEDDLGNLSFHSNVGESTVEDIADGQDWPTFDEPDRGLYNLVPPMAAQPGLVERVGGTAFYTRSNSEEDRLVIARLDPVYEGNGNGFTIGETAEFGPNDIPAIAKAVCDLALGEYRRDIKKFVIERILFAGMD